MGFIESGTVFLRSDFYSGKYLKPMLKIVTL